MRLYLSSYRVGNQPEQLKAFAEGRSIAFIPNAMDHVDAVVREKSNSAALEEVRRVGLDVELLDLKLYFRSQDALKVELARFGGVWVRGGNTFVLRQAMRLSGFDEIVSAKIDTDFLYAGYSAGVCVLAPSLDGLQQVDDLKAHPYSNSDVIWEGLGLLDYLILPHYKSDHPESNDIEKEVEYCKREDIRFRTLRDGEVITMDTLASKSSA
jgi:dipeptidase E